MHVVQSQGPQRSLGVIGGAIGVCAIVLFATAMSVWIGDTLRPLGLALMWLQFVSAVFLALKLFGFAPVQLLLVLVGYPGDRYDVPADEPSMARWLAQFIEFGCCIGALVVLLRYFYA